MSYFDLLSIHNLALLSDWLDVNGELFVEVYHPHSGGGPDHYLIQSMNDFKSLLKQDTWPEIVLTVFAKVQYPLRGMADDHLLEMALRHIPDGQQYLIVSLNPFPAPCSCKGDGKSHAELRRDFQEISGEEVAIGIDVDVFTGNERWIYAHASEVFRLSVTKNQTAYENYGHNPERYKFLEDLRR